jgi:hypothetical protein
MVAGEDRALANGHRCFDVARGHRVDPDTVAGVLQRRGAGEADHAVLGGAVGRRPAAPAVPAMDAVLTIAPPAARMARSCGTMQLKTPVRLMSSTRCHSAMPWSSVSEMPRDARVVEGCIEPAEALEDRRDHGLAGSTVAHIERLEHRLRAGRLQRGHAGFAAGDVLIGNDHRRARLGKPLGRRPANAGSAPRDQCNPSVQSCHESSLVVFVAAPITPHRTSPVVYGARVRRVTMLMSMSIVSLTRAE